jgi:hypothetical protein
MHAQLTMTNSALGVVDVSYSVDVDFYDPLGDPTIYLYLWVDTDQTDPELPFLYNDEWGLSTSLITINWSDTDSKFIGTIDFNTHDFIGEGVLLGGIQLNNFNLLLRNEAGDHQSGNLLASDFGFNPTQTLDQLDVQLEKSSYYAAGILHLNDLMPYQVEKISVFNSIGKLIYSKKIMSTETNLEVNLSFLPRTFAIIHVSTNTNKYFTKRVIL